MKTFRIVVAIVATSTATFAIAPAFAQSSASSPAQGHYEWRAPPQYGPRGPLQAPRRIWVPDVKQVAACNCDMMKLSSAAAADCMKGMPGMASPSGASAS